MKPALKKVLINTIASWLPTGLAIVVLCGIIFKTIEQNIRLSANLAPEQYALDTREKLENGTTPEQAIDDIPHVDIQRSLASFVIIYKSDGSVDASSAILHGYYPIPPTGVFDYVRQKGEDRLTWAPKPGLRFAAVVLPYSINGMEGFVLAGCSLTECEKSARVIYYQTLMGLVLALTSTFGIMFVIKAGVAWAREKNQFK